MSISDDSALAISRDNGDVDSRSWAEFIGKQSPYQNSKIATLFIGPEATEFLVHDSVLKKSEPLRKKCNPYYRGRDAARFPELEESIAHTLIHYLYTSHYEVLDTSFDRWGYVDETLEAYIYASQVYCAAIRYEVPGLADLAREQITTLDADITIPQKLTVARKDAFPQLPEDDTWYATYIHGLIIEAMRINAAWCRTSEFLELIEGSPRLLRIGWTAVTNFSEEIETPVLDGHETPIPSVSVGENEVSAVEAPCAPESPPPSESPPPPQEAEQWKGEHGRSDSAVHLQEEVVQEKDGWGMNPDNEVKELVDGDAWFVEDSPKKKKKKAKKAKAEKMEILPMGV